MAGHIVPREGRGLGDTVVRFLGPGPAAGQAWGRERCLGQPCGRRTHTRTRMQPREKGTGREGCGSRPVHGRAAA